PLIEMDAFKERGYGDAEGLTKTERDQKFPGMRTYPNQEPREAVTARVTAGIEEILETYPNKKVLLISHGGAINAIDRKSTRMNSSHVSISYAVFCLKKK